MRAELYRLCAFGQHGNPVSVSHLGQMVANCPPMIEITGWYHEVR